MDANQVVLYNSVAGFACAAMVLAGCGAALAGEAVTMEVTGKTSSFVEVLSHAHEWAGKEGLVEVLVPERYAGEFEATAAKYIKAMDEGGVIVKPEGLFFALVNGYAPPERAAEAEALKFVFNEFGNTQAMSHQITKVWSKAGVNADEMAINAMNSGTLAKVGYFDATLYPAMTGGKYTALYKEPFVAVAYGNKEGIAGELEMKGAPYTVSADGGKVKVLGQDFDAAEWLKQIDFEVEVHRIGDVPNEQQEKLQELFTAEVAKCIAEARKSSASMRRCYNLHAQRDEGTSWFPRTRESVEATKYDYGLYVKPPLERAVEQKRR